MTEPTAIEFLYRCDLRLSDVQIDLAESLIEYRKKHHAMAAGGGRTTVVNVVQEYFEICGYPRAGREI